MAETRKNFKKPYNDAEKNTREFSTMNTSYKVSSSDINFAAKYNSYYKNLEAYYDGDISKLRNWTSIIGYHSKMYAKEQPLYKYSKVVDKNNNPMITLQDVQEYEDQLHTDPHFVSAIKKYHYVKNDILNSYKYDQLHRLRKQYNEYPYLWDYSESQGNPDGLFEFEKNQGSYEVDKILEEMNKLALGEKYVKIQPEGKDQQYCVRIKLPMMYFDVPRVLGFIKKRIIPFWESQKKEEGMNTEKIKTETQKFANPAGMLSLFIEIIYNESKKDTIQDLVSMMQGELSPKEIEYFLYLSEQDLPNVAKQVKQYLRFERAKEMMQPQKKKDLVKQAKKRLMLHNDNNQLRDSEYDFDMTF